MFGLGFWEIAIIALVTLIFVKPEDLPKILRKIGYYYGRVKEIGRSVQSQVEDTETFFWDKPDSSNKDKEE
jgi:sec-independent protein translocase protein TatB